MADYISTQRSKFSEVLDGRDWEVFDKQATVYVSLTEDAELWRSLPELSPDFISEFTDLLNLITDIKNTVECHCVDDPMASGEVFEGRWRQAFIRRIAQGDVTKLVQVLRKGYSSAIAWDEARLVEGKDLRVSEGYRTVRWVNLDPTKTQTMALSLSAVSYTDKVVNGEKLSGEWHNISVSPSIADDGSGVITMQLAQPEFTLTAYQNALTPKARDVTYYFQVPKDLAQAIITAAKKEGASATANYGNASGLVDIVVSTRNVTKTEKKDVITAWDCRYKEYTDYYFGLSEAEADAIVLIEDTTPAWDIETTYAQSFVVLYATYHWISLVADNLGNAPETGAFWVKTVAPESGSSPTSGWSYKLRKTNNGDGTWDVFVTKRQVQYRDAAFQNSQVGGDSTVTTRQQLGLTTQTAEPVTSTAGVVMSQRVDIKDDCSKDVHTNKDTGIAQTSTLTVAAPSRTSTTVEKSVQSAVVTTVTSAKGHIKRSVNKNSKYPSRYDTTEADEIPTDQTAVSVDNSKSSVNTRTLHTENDTDLTTPAITKGTITRQSATPSEAGNQRTVVEVIEPTDQTAVSVDNSQAFVLTKTIHTENDTDLTTPAVVAGTITRQVATPTEAGNQRTVEDVLIPTNQTETGESHSHAADSTQKVDTEMSVVDYDALDKTAEAASGDAAPAWDEEETYALEAVVRSGTSYWASLKASNLNNEPTVGDTWWVKTVPPSAGSIRDVSATPTEAGNVRVQDRTTVPVNQIEIGESHSAAVDSTDEIDTEMAKTDYDALDKEAADGTIRDVRAAPTEAGNVRVQDRTATPIDQTAVSQDASSAAVSSKTSHTENPDALSHPGKAKGFIYREEAAPTEAGNLRTTEETISAYEQTEISGEDSLAQSVERTVIKENGSNAGVVPTAAAGTVKRITATPTDFGNANTTEEVTTPKARTLTEGSADAFKTSENTIKTQELTQEAVPSATAGKVIIVRNEPTATGFKTEKNEVTAVADDSGAVISYTDDAIITTQKYHNAAAIVDATDSTGHNITVDGDINEFKKYDYVKKDVEARIPRSFGESAVTYDTLGGWYGIGLWRIRYHHTINYHTTAAAAATALADGWVGSGISSAGNNLWQSHKKIRDDIYTG